MITPFPLLAKELTEQSARRRTFVLRAAYGLLLLGVFILYYINQSDASERVGLGMLGKGRGLFSSLVAIQCWMITLVMPAMAAGAITAEKESGTLVLLMLTDLGPWELLLQKCLSRIIAVGSLVLASVPLLALAYSLGGFSTTYLICGICTLLLCLLQTAAFAIAMSCLFGNSTTSLVATYALLAACFLVSQNEYFTGYHGYYYIRSSVLDHLMLLAPLRYFQEEGQILDYGTRLRSVKGMSMAPGTLYSAAILLSTVCSLALARIVILRNPQPTGMSPLLRLFRMLDRWFERADAAIGRRRGQLNLPATAPVAWREFNRRSFSNWRYLLRLVLPLHMIMLGMFMVVAHADLIGSRNEESTEIAIFIAVQTAMALFLMILASGLFARERGDQTLDVLLTTPMTGREILAQKVSSLRRIHLALASVPVVILGCVWAVGARVSGSAAIDLLFAGFSILILPALFAWIALWFGLRIRNRLRAIAAALLVTLLWLGGGVVEKTLHATYRGYDDRYPWRYYDRADRFDWDFSTIECCLSPLTAIMSINELDRLDVQGDLVVAMAWYSFLWWWLRRKCLRDADRLLRRALR